MMLMMRSLFFKFYRMPLLMLSRVNKTKGYCN